MAVILGLDHHLYIQTNGAQVEPWPSAGYPAGLTEVGIVTDLTLNGDTATDDVSTRSGSGFRQQVSTLSDISIEFDIIYDPVDAAFDFLRTSYINKSTFGCAVLDGLKSAEGTEGFWLGVVVTGFQKDEQLEEAGKVSITLTSSRLPSFPSSGSQPDVQVNPQQVTVGPAGLGWAYSHAANMRLDWTITNTVSWSFDPGTGDATTDDTGTGTPQAADHDYSSQTGVYYPSMQVALADILVIDNTVDSDKVFHAMPSFEGLTGLQRFKMNAGGATGPFPDISDCTGLIEFQNANSAMTGSVPDLSGFTSLATLTVNDNLLSGWLGSAVPASLLTVDLSNNSLSQANVDAVLDQLDTAGSSSGTVDLTGNSIPSAAGLADKTSLEGKSWTVSVDS